MKVCSKCGKARDRAGQRYCRKCHNAYQRRTRTKYQDMSEEEQRRTRCRSYTNVMLQRGTLLRGPCEDCGGGEVRAHHRDYTKPREVHWLCLSCYYKRRGIGLHKPKPPGMSLDDVLRKWA